MTTNWLPSASYSLWLQFSSSVGKEHLHCDMKRGFTKARQKEPQVKALLEQDNIHQQIGKFAQQGVYEFHQNTQLLYQPDGLERVADVLQLSHQPDEVQERVIPILKNYQQNPILVGKNIIQMNRGDEGFPTVIPIQQGSYKFNLYVVFDCLFAQTDGTLHILDFKTGKSDFDRRQAYVYLLAAHYLYPQQQAVASFYNLELNKASDPIAAIPEQLNFVEIELADIAKKHQLEKKRYWQNPADFAQIFPPNPGITCRFCPFASICEFSVSKVST